MKKFLTMCLALCMVFSCGAVSAMSIVNVQNPALYFNSFESVEDVTNNAITLQNKTFEENGAGGSGGAMRALFQSGYAKYQPSYGLRYFQFQPDVTYELSMWMKFHNAENIKAPKIQILSYYDKNQNDGMIVYADDTLTTEKTSTFAAGSVSLSAEDAGWVAEDGSVKPGWHKVTIPFSVQKKMLWGAYLDPEKIADLKASFLFRFGAVNDVMNDPANYMDDYVASVTAEEGTEEYYKSFYMDISFDDISIKRTVDSSAQDSKLFYNDFETEADIAANNVTLQNKSLDPDGADGSEGAMRTLFQSEKANYQPSYGLQFFRFLPDVEYELSMWMKFNNAENIKAPEIRILTYYSTKQNENLIVYADDALTTTKNSNYAAGSVWQTAEEAGWVAEDGSVKPGWHKVTIPFSVQKKMLWGGYLDPEKISGYEASFLFRFGAKNDNMVDPANYMDSYVASIEAEEGTEEYYKNLYMDISFDNISIERKTDSSFKVSNLTSDASGDLRVGQNIALTYETQAFDNDPISKMLLNINQTENNETASVYNAYLEPTGRTTFRVPEHAFGKSLSAQLTAITESGAVSEAKILDLGAVSYSVTSSLDLENEQVVWSIITKNNTGAPPASGIAYMAFYNKDSKLVDLQQNPVLLQDTVSGTIAPSSAAVSMKLFVWEENSMKPVCEQKEIVVNIFAGKDEVNIVYLGGSITEGVGASDYSRTSYRGLVGKYFTETYSDIKVNNVHQGVGGTGSDYGLIRLNRDVMSYNPDLVFVEFAVNDNGKDSRLEMETIVRTLSAMENPPYIIYLYTTRSSFANVKPYHVEVGNHYDIPQIDLQQELLRVMAETGNDVSVYLPDGVHPSDAGHKVYADKIIECLQTGKYYRYPNVTDNKLMESSGVAEISCISAKDATLSGSWTEAIGKFDRPVMISETAGDTLTFTFTGNFFGLEHALNLAGGDYEVYVDGELYNTNYCYYRNVNYYHSRFGCADFLLPDGTHTVEIKVLGTKPTDDSTGTKVCMVNLFYGTIER